MFYLNNHNEGYPSFSSLAEALRASELLGGEVWALTDLSLTERSILSRLYYTGEISLPQAIEAAAAQ